MINTQEELEDFLQQRVPENEWTAHVATREAPTPILMGWFLANKSRSGVFIPVGASARGVLDILRAGPLLLVTRAYEAIDAGERTVIFMAAQHPVQHLLPGDALLFTPHCNFPRAIVTEVIDARPMPPKELTEADAAQLGPEFRTNWLEIWGRPFESEPSVWRVEFRREGRNV